jgi:transposase
MAIPVSPDTLIRLLLKCPVLENQKTVRVLGVDDWAFRKGNDYGTILVDLERNCPVDLLPDRSAESFEQWLKAHPGVEVISRDRASCYSKGGKDGAPKAVQVADRWHLLKNLGDATQRLLAKFPSQLKVATDQAFNGGADDSSPISMGKQEFPRESNTEPVTTAQPRTEVMSRSELLFRDIKRLQSEGKGVKATARELGISRTTIRKYRAVDEFPQRARPTSSKRKADPYKGHLLKSWKDGERNGSVLFKEIVDLGFDGSPSSVYRVISEFPGYADDKPKRKGSRRKVAMLSPRKAAKIFCREQKELSEKESLFCDVLVGEESKLKIAQTLILEFSDMVRNGRNELFTCWLDKASACSISDLEQFSKSLKSDYDAVLAALTLPWSSGQVEGQVNRLKTIKRSMYGRSRFALLKKRVLRPP